MHFVKYLPSLVFLFVATQLTLCSALQVTQDPPSPTDVLVELRSELQSLTDLDSASRAQIESELAAAESDIARGAELEKLAKAYNELPAVGDQRKVLEQQLAAVKQAQSAAPSTPASNDTLTSEIRALKDRVEVLKKQTVETGNEGNRRTARREEIRVRLLAIESELLQVEAQLAKLPVTDTSVLSRAKRFRLMIQQKKIEFESEALENELARFNAEETEGILQLQLELYRSQLARQQGLLSRLEVTRSDFEKKAAAEASQEAKKQQTAIVRGNPLLAASYEVNTELAVQNEEFVKESADIATELKGVKNRLDVIQRQFAETEVMVEQVGLSGSVGNLLRQRKSDLPNSQLNRNKARELKRRVELIQFQLFDINRRQSELTRESLELEILANDSATRSSLLNLDEQVDSLLSARQEILVASKRNVRALFDALVDMEFRFRTLANVSQEYRQYLNERIFWIKSNKLLFSEWEIDDSDKQLLKPDRWRETAASFVKSAYDSPLLFGFALFVWLALVVLRPRLRTELSSTGQVAGRGSCDSFWPTLRALFATLLLAIATPLPLLVVGIAIHESPLNDGRSLFSAIGYALIAAGSFALPVEILRHTCRKNGLAQQHLWWSNDGVSILKRSLGWLSPVGTVIVFALALFQRLDSAHRVDLTERLLFVVGMCCLCLFLRRIVSPSVGIFREYLQAHPKSWVNQTSTLWYLVIVGLPVLLAGLAIWGYYYTTTSLVLCAFSTFVFAVIVETLRALLMRFILVRRRHVHIESAKRKREADRELRKQKMQAKLQATGGTSQVLPDALPEMDPIVDIDENAVEATRLIGLGTIIVWAFGLWIIWADVLPALKALDKQPIFPSRLLTKQTASVGLANTVTPNGERSTEKPAAPSNVEKSAENKSTSEGTVQVPGVPTVSAARPASSEKELTAVTYGDLLLFLLITAITIAAARSLPSTLEMIFLNQLPLDRSVRYATKSLFSYAIILVGMVLAFRALSISWSNVQWLATALTFGLAFGLQEIFANFVAGIILMFERPMRLGDWITIDEFTGMVTKIRTRATTIVNLERKEFVIPNKDFITGRLVNWTLSDAINRVDINVGIAYGSDVDKAKQVLLQTCVDHPTIVTDPPASVVFEAFGDSSLNLVLRAFLRDIESRMSTIDELNTRINRAFIEAGIEISFPQRDLHIRSIAPKLEMALERQTESSIDDDKVTGDQTNGTLETSRVVDPVENPVIRQ